MRMAAEAGHAIVVKEGLAKLSARRVATDIGYTVGTIYNLFGTHDAFILHVNALTLDAWFADLERVVAKRRQALTFGDLAEYYIDYGAAHYHAFMALFEHTLPPEMPIPEWYVPKMRQFFEFLEGLVLPLVGVSRQPSTFIKVDLPAPFLPTRHVLSPSMI